MPGRPAEIIQEEAMTLFLLGISEQELWQNTCKAGLECWIWERSAEMFRARVILFVNDGALQTL